jgi:hypothetical protein
MRELEELQARNTENRNRSLRFLQLQEEQE